MLLLYITDVASESDTYHGLRYRQPCVTISTHMLRSGMPRREIESSKGQHVENQNWVFGMRPWKSFLMPTLTTHKGSHE